MEEIKYSETYWVSDTDKVFIKNEIQNLTKERIRIKNSGKELYSKLKALKLQYYPNNTYSWVILKDSEEYTEFKEVSNEYYDSVHSAVKLINKKIDTLKNQYDGKEMFVPKIIGMDKELFWSINKNREKF